MHCNELIRSITALAATLAEGRDADEIALLASIFAQLGDTLATIAAQQALCQAPPNLWDD